MNILDKRLGTLGLHTFADLFIRGNYWSGCNNYILQLLFLQRIDGENWLHRIIICICFHLCWSLKIQKGIEKKKRHMGTKKDGPYRKSRVSVVTEFPRLVSLWPLIQGTLPPRLRARWLWNYFHYFHTSSDVCVYHTYAWKLAHLHGIRFWECHKQLCQCPHGILPIS